jgi:hypothetical protein
MSENQNMFRSTRARIGSQATVQVSSAIHASGTLTEIGPDGRGAVDIGGGVVNGVVIPTMRRLNLHETDRTHQDKDDAHDDPSPC